MPVIKSAQEVVVVVDDDGKFALESNGDTVEGVLVGGSVVFGLLVLLMTSCCRSRSCNYDTCTTVKRYIQKSASSVIVNALSSFALYSFIQAQTPGRPIKCFTPYDYAIYIYFLFGAVSVMGAIRYIAIGLALSDTLNVGGYKIHNPTPQRVLKGFKGSSAEYQQLISPYLGFAMMMGAPLSLVAFGLVPQKLDDLLNSFQVCMSDGEANLTTKGFFLFIMLLMSAWGVVFVELVYSVVGGDLRGVPCTYKCPTMCNSPHVTSTLSTMYSFWVVVAVLTFLLLQATVSDYLLTLQFLIALDGFWLVLLCLVAAKSDKVIRM